MKDWTEVIKDRLLNDRSAVPEGELEVIERLIRSRRRRRVLVWSSIPFVFAASLALFLFLKNSGNIQTIEVKTPPEEERLWVETLSEPDRDLAPEHISKKKGEPLAVIHEQQPLEAVAEIVEEIVEYEEDNTPKQEAETSEASSLDAFGFDEPAIGTSPRRKRLKLSISAGGVSAGDKTVWIDPTKAGGISAPKQYVHNQPIVISYGIALRYPLTDRLDLASGISYYSCASTVLNTKVSQGLIKAFLTQQKASYLGVPLHLDWYPFKGRRFSMFVGAGGEARKCVYAKIGDERLKDNRIYYSAIALAGLKYEPIKHIGLFIEPQYSYSFLPENPAVRSALTEYPSSFSLKLGLSFEL